MKKNYEILAPAGSFAALQAAVQNGADAVYLSGKDFGARKFANNFSNDELVEAINYCHIRDVDVYVTVNTLVLNNEFDRLKKYLDYLYTAGVDAVIVQDIGVLNYIHKNYPDLEIHCSTQMSAQTVADIKYLGALGATRVVLGREMTIDDIRRAKRETNVQLEVFVHGSLCISVSGQCLMSSMIGGRSGNRGSCAQPCRQMYTLVNRDTGEKYQATQGNYLLSPKDLCTIEEIKDIVDAGAFSLKIEGRMKSPEYVATVVRAYKYMLEQAYTNQAVDTEALTKELKIFNRGFTRGHIFSESGPKLMSMVSPGNQGYYLGQVVKYDNNTKTVTLSLAADLNQSDEFQIRRKDDIVGGRVERLKHNGNIVKSCTQGQICEVNFKHKCRSGEEVYKTFDEGFNKLTRQTFDKEYLQIPIDIEVIIQKDTNITGLITDGKNKVSEKTEIVPQQAQKRAITDEEVGRQLAKLGGTPYTLRNVSINIDQNLSVPLKAINDLRRSLVEKLDDIRAQKYRRKSKDTGIQSANMVVNNYSRKEIEFTYSVSRLSQLKTIIELGAEVIYYKDLDTLDSAMELSKQLNYKGKLVPEIYKLTPDGELTKYRQLISKLQLDTVLIQSYGHIETFQDFNLVADYNLNIVNDMAYRFYLKKGATRITLSPELNLSQISAIKIDPHKTEIMGYGYLAVMAMKHCIVSTTLAQGKNCGLCYTNSFGILDKKKECFPILRRNFCNTEILNSRKLFLLDYLSKLEKAGVGFFRLNFVDETPKEVERIVNLHHNYIGSRLSNFDIKLIDKLKDSGTTLGHINRGIE